MGQPLFSVVIPCYNVARTVAETVASVSAQTMRDLEIIAVDNNCTDDTHNILAEMARNEPRLRVIHQGVQGLSAARNAGIAAAQGRFIALLDADDLWDADCLEAHRVNFETGADVSYSRVRLIDVAGRPTGQVTKPPMRGLTARDLLRSNPCTALIAVRATAFQRYGLFNEGLKSVEDQEWLFRAAAGGATLAGIDRVIASYRIMPGGLSADLETMLACHGQLLAAAEQVAPQIAAQNRRLSHGAMLRYCAQRVVEHGQSTGVARRYLGRMVVAAPELLVAEPITTIKVIVKILAADLRNLAGRRSARVASAKEA